MRKMIAPFYMKPFKEKILLTNDTGHHVFLAKPEFRDFVSDRITPDHPRYQELKDSLFFYHGSSEEYIRNAEPYLREYNSYLFEPTNLFILALTNACNNACVYCQANGNSCPSRMTKEDIDQILLRISETPARAITIEFQGGEPLLCFDLIQYAVLRASDVLADKDVSFTLVSNLILLTESMADFFEQYHVQVSTSLDGPKILHDKNRPCTSGQSSYDAVLRGTEILRAHHILGGAIQTTTAASLSLARDIVDTYESLGFYQIFLRPLTRLGAAARSWDTIGYSPQEYLQFYREALDEVIRLNAQGKPMSDYLLALLLSKIIHGKSVNYMELRSPCGAAVGQLAFTPGGNVFTCDEGRMLSEMGDDAFKLGNVYDDGYDAWMNTSCCKAVCSASLLDTLPGCCDCVYKPYCGVCPVINYALNGNITSVAKDRCEIYKGILDILFGYLYDGAPDIQNLFLKWSELV